MGKNKLRKFAEMETFSCVFQFPFAAIDGIECPMRGKWNEAYFHNDNPLVLELGCGKGEYAVGLGQRFPEKNYIGVDIKGARMWSGAKQVHLQGITNVAFLRTSIELIDRFFVPGEVSEIWITFPDPQMKSANKRLTGTRFMANYQRILKDGGTIHLKTDSPFLYTYTREMATLNRLPMDVDTADLYHSEGLTLPEGLLNIQTHYERQWLQRGLTIKYLKFGLPRDLKLVEPEIEIERDTYRSYHRDAIPTQS